MRTLKPLQTGVLQKPFSYTGRHFFCVSLLWAFRLDTGDVVLETDMWQALGDLLREGRVFDQSMPKDRGEFLVAGSFHAPRGEPVRQEAVSARVGSTSKKLLVSGPRYWRGGVMTRAEPIASMPIRYDQAFGGEGFPDNPIGRGFVAVADGNGSDSRPLPCIEYPHEAITAPSQTPRPASFEALDMGWRPRQRHAGTYDEEYLRTRMPGLADDVDWRVFNDAAEDQWIEGFFRGDEDFELVHMHPERSRLQGQLPGVRGRAFIERRTDPDRRDSPLEFREVPLRLDTVWLLPDAEIGVVIHRGTTEIAEDDGTDVVNLMAAHENLADDPRPTSHYREEMRKRADPEEGYRYMLDTRALLPVGCSCAIQDLIADDEMQMEHLGQDASQTFAERQQEEAREQIDGQVEKLRTQVEPHREQVSGEAAQVDEQIRQVQASLDGEHEPSEEERELRRIMDKAAPGAAGGGQVDITQVDFGAFDELEDYTTKLAEQQRKNAEQALQEQIEELRRQNDPERQELTLAIAEAERALASMNEPVPLPRPKLEFDVDHVREQLDALEQYRDEMRAGGVDEQEIREKIPDVESLRDEFADAERHLEEQYRDGAHYLEESRSPHPGEEPERAATLLAAAARGDIVAGGDFAFVSLAGATIRGLDLSNAYLEYVDFTGATLIDCQLVGAILAKAQLRQCRFERVDLTNANVGATVIDGAVFEDCDFTEARLGRASIRDSRFERCRLVERQEMFLETEFERASFIDCTMPQANFLERDLAGCSFRGCDLSESNFLQSDLSRTDFSNATLTSVNIVGTPAPGACFDDASMENVRFIDDPVLNDCSFHKASLQRANLRGADLAGAIFSRASLAEADLSEADLTGARLDRARATGAQFRKSNLGSAQLFRADLREASLMKARLLRTSFSGANLYSVSFLSATLGETELGDANLDNTILRDWRPWRG